MGAAEWLRHRLRDARPRPASVTRDAPAPLAPADDDSAPEEIPPLPQAVYIYFVDRRQDDPADHYLLIAAAVRGDPVPPLGEWKDFALGWVVMTIGQIAGQAHSRSCPTSSPPSAAAWSPV